MAYTNKTTKTQKKLEQALLNLMKEKKFEAITINDITELADVNRSTFYRHYLDKYELLEKIEDAILNNVYTYHAEVIATISNSQIPKDFTLADYINNKTNFFVIFENYLDELRLLLSTNGSIVFREKLSKTMFSVFQRTVNLVNLNLNNIEKDLLFNFQVGGFIAALEYWTEHPDLTASELFSFYYSIISNGVVNFVKDNMK